MAKLVTRMLVETVVIASRTVGCSAKFVPNIVRACLVDR